VRLSNFYAYCIPKSRSEHCKSFLGVLWVMGRIVALALLSLPWVVLWLRAQEEVGRKSKKCLCLSTFRVRIVHVEVDTGSKKDKIVSTFETLTGLVWWILDWLLHFDNFFVTWLCYLRLLLHKSVSVFGSSEYSTTRRLYLLMKHTMISRFLFCLFLTEEAWSHGGLRTRELGQTPLVLAWVANVSTSPDLYIEFSTEY
jgi:hypothetical protein